MRKILLCNKLINCILHVSNCIFSFTVFIDSLSLNITAMKKLILFSVFIYLLISRGYCQYPIPSYDVPVYHHSTFYEKEESRTAKGNFKGQKRMCIRITHGTNKVSFYAQVWVFTLDLKTVLGPYTATCDTTLYVNIDDQQWGVRVESDDHIMVDVWIDDGFSLRIEPGKGNDENSSMAVIRKKYIPCSKV